MVLSPKWTLSGIFSRNSGFPCMDRLKPCQFFHRELVSFVETLKIVKAASPVAKIKRKSSF